jgi:hypothetical protein
MNYKSLQILGRCRARQGDEDHIHICRPARVSLAEFEGFERFYVAGPYRPSRPRDNWQMHWNIEIARAITRELWLAGKGEWGVICPHANNAQMDTFPTTDEVFLAGDLKLIGGVDAVVLCPGWDKSEGTLAEIEYAHNRCLPIIEYPVSPEIEALRKLATQ